MKVLFPRSEGTVTCPICMSEENQIVAPQITPCGHIFCWHCYLRHEDICTSFYCFWKGFYNVLTFLFFLCKHRWYEILLSCLQWVCSSDRAEKCQINGETFFTRSNNYISTSHKTRRFHNSLQCRDQPRRS